MLLVVGLIFAAWLAWVAVIFTLFCWYFFRDPERVPPGDPDLLLAPADGRVVSVAPAVPPAELALGAAPAGGSASSSRCWMSTSTASPPMGP